jgi:hypothetical protein
VALSTAAASLATMVPSKKRGVLGAPQAHRVGEGEVAEVALGDVAVLDQLIGLRQRVAHVDDVEMPDIRAIDRVEPRAERVALAERGRVHPVVGLAAEIIGFRVEIDPVFLAGDLARGEIVEFGAPAGQVLRLGAGIAVAFAKCGGHIVVAARRSDR